MRGETLSGGELLLEQSLAGPRPDAFGHYDMVTRAALLAFMSRTDYSSSAPRPRFGVAHDQLLLGHPCRFGAFGCLSTAVRMGALNEFQPYLSTDNSSGSAQRRQGDTVVIGIKQTVELYPTGLHPSCHLDLR